MTIQECVTGRLVWARMGSFGWRPAEVVRIKRNGLVEVKFETGEQTNGTRHPDSLRPRNRMQKGADKPTPKEAAEISASESQR